MLTDLVWLVSCPAGMPTPSSVTDNCSFPRLELAKRHPHRPSAAIGKPLFERVRFGCSSVEILTYSAARTNSCVGLLTCMAANECSGRIVARAMRFPFRFRKVLFQSLRSRLPLFLCT
jgi:hypothetical protein